MRSTFYTLMVLLLLVGLALPGAAEEPSRPMYIALGDSVAAGSGASIEQHQYVSWVDRWATSADCRDDMPEACPRLELLNLSVGGATSDSLIANQLPVALAEIGARNYDADPGNDVVLITVDIGGNDLFEPVLAACSGGPTPACQQVIAAVFFTYGNNLGVILGSLRAAAGPDTEIVMMTYYNSLLACDLSPLAPLADLVLQGGPPLPFGFNDIIRWTAAATGVGIAETYGLLEADDLVGGTDCLHPDDSGHRKIGRAFRDVIR